MRRGPILVGIVRKELEPSEIGQTGDRRRIEHGGGGVSPCGASGGSLDETECSVESINVDIERTARIQPDPGAVRLDHRSGRFAGRIERSADEMERFAEVRRAAPWIELGPQKLGRYFATQPVAFAYEEELEQPQPRLPLEGAPINGSAVNRNLEPAEQARPQ
jgi:hypothetical protein